MKGQYPKIWFAVVLIALAVTAYFVVRATSKKPSPNVVQGNPPVSNDSLTYFNKDVGIRFDYPKGLQALEIPTEELVNSDLYYFGNARPDFAVEVSTNGEAKTGDAYLIALYKKPVDPGSLLGNYLRSTPAKVSINKPDILSQGEESISGVKYQKLESSANGTPELYAYELSVALEKGRTIYSMGLSKQGRRININEEEIRSALNGILATLRVNKGIYLDTLDWKKCENADASLSILYPPTMKCELISGPINNGYSNFNLTGTYVSGGNTVFGKESYGYYWINITKDASGIDHFLDTEYSCVEGSCPVYPVSLSEIKIGGNTFKVSQADTPFGNDSNNDIVERLVKLVGVVNGNVIYVMQNGLTYKRGVPMPLAEAFSQKVIIEIINSVESK